MIAIRIGSASLDRHWRCGIFTGGYQRAIGIDTGTGQRGCDFSTKVIKPKGQCLRFELFVDLWKYAKATYP